MIVQLIRPYGFCEGVLKAIQLAKKAKKDNPHKEVYVLGNLVHNERIIDDLEKEGLIVLDERKKSLESWIKSLDDGSIIVFSAHGHKPALDAIAKEKKLKIYDATCPFVKVNQKIIEKELEKGGEVIYIGEQGHAESEAAIGINEEKIHLYSPTSACDFSKVSSDSPLVISQTTMDPDEISSISSNIIKRLPSSRLAAKRCFSTKERQDNVKAADKDADLFIILGSKNSNNTMKLYKIAKEKYPLATVVRCLALEELKSLIKGKDYRKAIIASGASSSPSDVESVYNYLISK